MGLRLGAGDAMSCGEGQRNPILLKVPMPPAPTRGGPLSWGKAGWPLGSLEPHSCPVTLRVEEVNWAAWEQTLPTVCEEPSGPPGSSGE